MLCLSCHIHGCHSWSQRAGVPEPASFRTVMAKRHQHIHPAWCVCLCVCVCVCMCVRACVRACVRTCTFSKNPHLVQSRPAASDTVFVWRSPDEYCAFRVTDDQCLFATVICGCAHTHCPWVDCGDCDLARLYWVSAVVPYVRSRYCCVVVDALTGCSWWCRGCQGIAYR